ncbi:GAF domain-containing protein [bacterium]|nr:GAF domain-containing protein [bacterium]
MDTTQEIPPAYLAKWQKTLDILAELFEVPAALIMRVWPEQIEVLLASLGESNPYEEHEKAELGTGLYCETVMATRSPLLVPNALADPAWDHNPDLKLNMVNYLGVPLIWPDDEIFGTICVLDAKTRTYSEQYQMLLWHFKEVIEADFRKILHPADAGGIDEQRIKLLEGKIEAMLGELGRALRDGDRTEALVPRVPREAVEAWPIK